MKAFGVKRSNDESEQNIRLKTIAIQVSPEELDVLIAFLSQARDAMKQYKADFGHDHYQEFCSQNEIPWAPPDLIVAYSPLTPEDRIAAGVDG